MGVRGCGLPGLRAVRIGRNAPTGMASPTSRQGHGYRCLRCRRVMHLSFLLGRLGGFAEDCFFSSRRFDALPGSTECTAHGSPRLVISLARRGRGLRPSDGRSLRVCLEHAASISRARAIQGRAESPDARGCQGSDRPRHPRQASDNRLRPGRIPPGRARAFRPARAAARGQRGPQRAEGFRW